MSSHCLGTNCNLSVKIQQSRVEIGEKTHEHWQSSLRNRSEKYEIATFPGPVTNQTKVAVTFLSLTFNFDSHL